MSKDPLLSLKAPSDVSQEWTGVLNSGESATCQRNDRELQQFSEQRLLSFKQTRKIQQEETNAIDKTLTCTHTLTHAHTTLSR